MRMQTLLTILCLSAGYLTAQTPTTYKDSKSTRARSAKHHPFDDGSPVQVSDTSSAGDEHKKAGTFTLSIVLPHPVTPHNGGLGHHGSDDSTATVLHVQCINPAGSQISVSGNWAMVLTDTTGKQAVILANADSGHGVDVVHANANCSFTGKTLTCTAFQTATIQLYDGTGSQSLACTNGEVDVQYH
jgi:hypothetical protein